MRFGIVSCLLGVALLAGCEGEKGSAGVPCDDACVTSESIADAAVLGNHIAAGAVGSAALADGSVTASKLAPDSVAAAAIQDGAVGTSAIGSQSIVTALLADLAVTTGKIADGAVGALQIAAGAVGTTHIEDGGVTGADLDPALAGYGLKLLSNVLSADTAVVQARVGGCPAGTAIRSVDVTGTAVCEPILDARFITGKIPAGSGSDASELTGCILGELRLFGTNFAPRGTFVADGRSLMIADHTALFSLFGTEYGGDGVTTFNLPDLRQHAPQGVSYVVCAVGIFPSLP